MGPKGPFCTLIFIEEEELEGGNAFCVFLDLCRKENHGVVILTL